MDWKDGAAGVGIIGGLVTMWNVLMGRRESRVREIAKAVLVESELPERMKTVEVVLPRIEANIAEVKDAVTRTNELLLSGRLQIRGDE